MTRYFMRDTPLCQLEQQMMTPPNFKPRGHGRYSPGFQYSSEDTECPYCINFRRNQPCPLKLCICLDERIAAGALNLNEFVRDCFFPEAGVQLQARLERNFTCCSISFFLNESHRERWQHWHARCYRMSGRNLAALFLLTAYEDRLFSDLNPPDLAVSDTFLRDAGNGDFCFVEDAALAPVEKRIEKLIIFKWNRTYPADRYFDLKLYEGAWHLALSSDFAGCSHERITMEVFER